MDGKIISGIQQIGIGVSDVHAAFRWYRQNFGMSVPVFEEAAEAALMLPYTGGEARSRHAILAINMQGGGGFEIWQYTSRTPEGPSFQPQLGDLGINIAKMKSKNVDATYDLFNRRGLNVLGELQKDPYGKPTFFIKDPWDNIFQIVTSNSWFQQRKTDLPGGPNGAIIGVTDIEKARTLYSDILGYDTVTYDEEGVFDDLKAIPGGDKKVKRVLLRHSKAREGAFSPLLGASEIELVVAVNRKPQKIFENRFWGDLGYIHLCYDINGMEALKTECESKGFPFTVDSANSFDMGEAAGHFTYVEDPDGALIEFVETHKVPIMKKIGWYLNLKKRDPKKSLPRFMLKAMGLSEVKD
ncbi:Catechol 2,3-dioxygenase [Marivirga sericea]|uniref:Catechol 2,3-dioxygenase n=1 Tax=Marivirga sericea TaxID=1028 RepID=A0A1X7LA46_9BACT|nr:VOC family protein [Marivirga sericea]SMG50263.1 Catechol 2,3-dioxygenase [Marivirga sericea]